QLEQPRGYIRLLAELRDLPEDREILIRDLERRRDDEEKEIDRLLVDRLEVDSLFATAEGDAQLVHDERAGMGNRDPAADSCRAEVLAPLEHLEQHSF